MINKILRTDDFQGSSIECNWSRELWLLNDSFRETTSLVMWMSTLSDLVHTCVYMPALRILNYGKLNIGRPIIDFKTILISARPPSLSYSSPQSNFVAAML